MPAAGGRTTATVAPDGGETLADGGAAVLIPGPCNGRDTATDAEGGVGWTTGWAATGTSGADVRGGAMVGVVGWTTATEGCAGACDASGGNSPDGVTATRCAAGAGAVAGVAGAAGPTVWRPGCTSGG
ncbi:MAG: hypothetical protein WCY11_17025, partial [Novosphingobium sp.]